MTRTSYSASMAILCTILWAGDCHAHPGGHGSDDSSPDPSALRVWTLAGSDFHIHGTFVSVRGDVVQIRNDDGTLFTLRRGTLSQSDQHWITRRVQEIRRLNSQPQIRLASQRDSAEGPGQTQTDARNAPAILQHFTPFGDKIKSYWDREWRGMLKGRA